MVRLVGGKKIPKSSFKPVSNPEVLARINQVAKNKVLRVDLQEVGITDYGKLESRGKGRPEPPSALELFFQERPMQLARYPNKGWLKIASVPEEVKGGGFIYSDGNHESWTNADEIWMHGYWKHPWADSYERVKSLNFKTKEVLTYPPHGCYGYYEGGRFYFLNILEELDSPGEWYLDREHGFLYFWPPAPIIGGEAYVSLIETLIAMNDVSYVTFLGLHLEGCRGTAVTMEGGHHNQLASCTLRNIGKQAVTISGGTHNGVMGCDVLETGYGGIRLNGGNRKTLSPAQHYTENNHIYRYSRWCRTCSPAISLEGVGNRASHNRIPRCPACRHIY